MKMCLITLCSLLLTIAPCLAASTTVPAVDTALHYTMWGGGFNMVDADVNIHIDKGSYRGAIAAATKGTIGAMFPWWNRVEASGTVNHGRLLPQKYNATYSWKDTEKSTTLTFNPDGSFKAKETVPQQAQPNPAETAPELTRDAPDIMTNTLQLMLRLAQGQQCNKTLAVYDGKRRFNLIFTEIEFEKLTPTPYSFFDGGARRCDMLMQTVAGKWRKNQFTWVTDPQGDMKMSVWMGKLTPDGAEVPVRARTYGEFGTVLIHLNSANYNGKNFATPATD